MHSAKLLFRCGGMRSGTGARNGSFADAVPERERGVSPSRPKGERRLSPPSYFALSADPVTMGQPRVSPRLRGAVAMPFLLMMFLTVACLPGWNTPPGWVNSAPVSAALTWLGVALV